MGTGLGSTLFHDGKLIPNLELAHHEFYKGKTYEHQLGKKAYKKKSKKKWNKRLKRAICSLEATFHYDRLYIGGSKAKKINFDLPDNVQTVPNIAGILGGIALWKDDSGENRHYSKFQSKHNQPFRLKTMTSNKQIAIEPSILSANFAYLGKGVTEAQEAGAKAIQIDIMDGQFVPNISFGWDTVAAIRPLTDMFLDIHLMIVRPERYINAFAKAGADRLIVHQETCTHLHRVLSSIKELNIET